MAAVAILQVVTIYFAVREKYDKSNVYAAIIMSILWLFTKWAWFMIPYTWIMVMFVGYKMYERKEDRIFTLRLEFEKTLDFEIRKKLEAAGDGEWVQAHLRYRAAEHRKKEEARAREKYWEEWEADIKKVFPLHGCPEEEREKERRRDLKERETWIKNYIKYDIKKQADERMWLWKGGGELIKFDAFRRGAKRNWKQWQAEFIDKETAKKKKELKELRINYIKRMGPEYKKARIAEYRARRDNLTEFEAQWLAELERKYPKLVAEVEAEAKAKEIQNTEAESELCENPTT